VEIAMREVPERIKEIKDNALNKIFLSEIESMDDNSRELLGRVISYIEKKYISVPMVIAKDILIKNS
jgi:glutamyl-tRNA reductase